MKFNTNDILSECTFKTSRSSGPGGQHANKVETRVTLLFNINKSTILDDDQKEKIKKNLANKINKEGVLQISSQKYKSQIKNKVIVEYKLIELLEISLREKKKRLKTKVPRSVKRKRLKDKKIRSEIKSSRLKPKML